MLQVMKENDCDVKLKASWYEDRRKTVKNDKRNYSVDMVTVFSVADGPHTSGTEWSMEDRSRPVDILDGKQIQFPSAWK